MSSELPQEIEEEIFKYAARTFPGDAPKMSLVSKRIQNCVERIIYESLFLVVKVNNDKKSPDTACIQRILPTITSRPAIFFAEHVKNLCLPYTTPLTAGCLILAKCTRIRHLVLWLEPTTEAVPWMPPLTQSLESLITNTLLLKELYKAGFVFPNVKFIIISETKMSDIRCISTFAWLPALEIIIMDVPISLIDLDILLCTAPKLKTILLHVWRSAVERVQEWVEELPHPVEIRINDPVADQSLENLWRMTCQAINIEDLNVKLKTPDNRRESYSSFDDF